MSTATTPPPRSPLRAIFRGTGIYSIALIGQRMASVIVTPIVTRSMPLAQYGVMELLDQIGSVLSILLGGNFSAALGYFYFETDSPEQRRKTVGASVFGGAIIGLTAGLICWPFAGVLSRTFFHSNVAVLYLHVMFINLPLLFAAEALFGWLRVADLSIAYVRGALLRIGLSVVSIIFLVGLLKLEVFGMILSSVIAAGSITLIVGAYCMRRGRPMFDLLAFRRMASFLPPFAMSGMSMFVINFGDRFFLSQYASFQQLGMYGLAYKLGMMISSVYACFQNYWTGQVYAIMRRDDADALFGRIFTYVTLVMALCFLGLLVGAKPAVRILAPADYGAAARLVPLIAGAYAIRGVGDFFRSLFLVAGRPGFDSVCTGTSALLCLGGYWLLIPRYGMWGAAIATFVTFAIMAVLVVSWTYRMRRYRLEGSRLIKIGIALLAISILHIFVPLPGFLAEVGWAVAAVLGFLLLLVALRFPTPAEWGLVNRASGLIRQRLALARPQ